ncbi:MAG: efflux RND transporter periplasmic adaptor subunit, partial [Bilophila sp.]
MKHLLMKNLFCYRASVVGVAFGLLLLGAGCSSEKEHARTMPPPLVSVMTVVERNVPVTNTFVGQTEGSRAVEVRAQVSGILMSRSYDEGAYVERGKLLFEIEPNTYKAALAQAKGVMAQTQAKFVQSKQDLDRVIPLYAKNAVSQRDRDMAQSSYNSAKADLDAAKAAVNEAEIKLGYAYVTAPVSGYAGREYRTVGNLITAGSVDGSLLTVVNKIDPIYAN